MSAGGEQQENRGQTSDIWASTFADSWNSVMAN